MLVPTYRECATALREIGYLPIPIAPFSKRPLIEAWQKWEHQPGAEAQFQPDAGVGILCGYVRAIDIDVTRPELAALIQQAAQQAFGGDIPIRIGAPPKLMLLLRTTAVGYKLMSLRFRFPDDPPGSKPHGIEIMGLGQQIIVYGKHPDTRRDYTWPQLDLLEVPLQSLPVVTEDELQNFVGYVNNLLLEHGGIPVGSIAHRDAEERSSNDELAAYNDQECRAAIDAIPNDDLSWDDWIYIGLAIKGALGEEGRAAFHAFSNRSNKYDPAVTDRTFSSFKPERIGAGTLYRTALDHGWQRPTYHIDLSALLSKPGTESDRLRPRLVDELLRQQSPGWLVRGVIPKAGLVLIYGQSGSGKSFFTLDLAAAIARGTQWQGRRVKQGGVILIAGEGHVRMRLAAYLKHNNLQPANLASLRVVNTNLDLRNPRADLTPLIIALKKAAEEMGGVVMVVLDTLNSMMGAGDENESSDMGAMIQAGRAIMAALSCTLAYIHHSGKDEDRGARGHSSLRAAVDTEMRVRSGDGGRLASITKQRDGETDIDFPFTLATVDLGPSTDPDADHGEHDTSCAVTPTVAIDVSALKSKRPLSGNASILLRIVQPTPAHKTAIRMDFYVKLPAMEQEAKKKAFQRAFYELSEAKLVDEGDGLVWLAHPRSAGT